MSLVQNTYSARMARAQNPKISYQYLHKLNMCNHPGCFSSDDSTEQRRTVVYLSCSVQNIYKVLLIGLLAITSYKSYEICGAKQFCRNSSLFTEYRSIHSFGQLDCQTLWRSFPDNVQYTTLPLNINFCNKKEENNKD